jgi:hypothetical protein
VKRVAVLIGILWVAIAYADEKLVTPDEDSRLANLSTGPPRRIGLLSYYPNKGGGYTFLEQNKVLFYSLPYEPTTRQVENMVLPAIGTAKVPFSGQTVYRSQFFQFELATAHRMDTAIAKWTRDSPSGTFRLSIMSDDRETRLKLKSIVPVLETSSLAEQKSPTHKQAPPITYEVIKSKPVLWGSPGKRSSQATNAPTPLRRRCTHNAVEISARVIRWTSCPNDVPGGDVAVTSVLTIMRMKSRMA